MCAPPTARCTLPFLDDVRTCIYCTCTCTYAFPLQDSNPSREQPIYPSSILSPINRSPPPTTLPPSLLLPPQGGTPRHHHPCIDLPLPKGRLEPGEGVKMSLILQGLLPPSLFVASAEVPWHILFYYEPALITANSRIR